MQENFSIPNHNFGPYLSIEPRMGVACMKHEDRKDVLKDARSDLGDAVLSIAKASRDISPELCLEQVLAAHRLLIEALAKVDAVGIDLKSETGREIPIQGNWETEAILDGLDKRALNILRKVANIANGRYRITENSDPETRMIAERGHIAELIDFGKLSYPLIGTMRGAGLTTLVILKEYFDSKNIELSE